MKVLNLALLVSTIGLVGCGSDSGSTQQTKVKLAESFQIQQ